jgi:hypothetical protein
VGSTLGLDGDQDDIFRIFTRNVKDSQTVNPRRSGGKRCTATFTIGQHVRFFKVSNSNGNVKKGMYIMTMDFSGVNYFNDNVFLLENVKPA